MQGAIWLHEPVPLQPLIEEARRQAQQLDEQREIAGAVQDVTVLGDRDALKQVVLILLDNALKHTQGPIRSQPRPPVTRSSSRCRTPARESPPIYSSMSSTAFTAARLIHQSPVLGWGCPSPKPWSKGWAGQLLSIANRVAAVLCDFNSPNTCLKRNRLYTPCSARCLIPSSILRSMTKDTGSVSRHKRVKSGLNASLWRTKRRVVFSSNASKVNCQVAME